ncbi:hypothetical protein [Cohnella abietis]|uniref:Uncharacterized protein n=1 Tax=Cohnella abietis TaxID=2507935 RepID=A0A3T1D7A7_9BACL|nr:hypothetical protein [Cohnella abietis]BBI33980.1 hypothetical protein KCTCHS21_33790 [Cohnella abietis]
MFKKVYIFCIALILVGCSMGNKVSDVYLEETDPGEAAKALQPKYIDESKYEGDELGIVKALNLYMKALYEKDYDALNALMPKDNEKITSKLSKYFISFDRLDFTVKPDPTPPEDVKPVVVEFKTKIYDHKEEMEEDKQLFLFRLEDGLWKLVAIADWW